MNRIRLFEQRCEPRDILARMRRSEDRRRGALTAGQAVLPPTFQQQSDPQPGAAEG